MFANLVVLNAVDGRTSEGSVEFSGNPNDVIQLTINGNMYTFNGIGIMQNVNKIASCVNLNSHSSCVQILQGATCEPRFIPCEPRFIPNDQLCHGLNLRNWVKKRKSAPDKDDEKINDLFNAGEDERGNPIF